MKCWEYRTIYIELGFDEDDCEPDNTQLEDILSYEAARGWEVFSTTFCGNAFEMNHAFWIVFRRKTKNRLIPFLKRGYSEKDLNILWHHTHECARFRPLTKKDLNYLFEHAPEVFKEKPHLLLAYRAALDKGFTRKEALKKVIEMFNRNK